MALRFLSALSLVIVLGVAGVAVGATRDQRVPHLIGLKRSAAERRLAKHGLGYLMPTPFAARYEAIGADEAVPEASAPDRRVVSQDPSAGATADKGDTIDFATVLPPDAGRGDASPFPRHVDRTAVAGDGRHIAVHYRAYASRCQALDHVDVGIARRYVVVFPSLTSTIRSENRCSRLVRRVVHLELPKRVRDRLVVDDVPLAPTRGLYDVAPSRYSEARGSAHARAIALYYISSSDCGLLARTKVRETRHTVTVTMFTGNLGRSGYCLANAIEGLTIVPLRHPLGERRIVDGARRH